MEGTGTVTPESEARKCPSMIRILFQVYSA
jgi:hypothetical protein